MGRTLLSDFFVLRGADALALHSSGRDSRPRLPKSIGRIKSEGQPNLDAGFLIEEVQPASSTPYHREHGETQRELPQRNAVTILGFVVLCATSSVELCVLCG